jgi:hypothetical protein
MQQVLQGRDHHAATVFSLSWSRRSNAQLINRR